MHSEDPAELLDLLYGLLHTLRRESSNDSIGPGQARFLRMLNRLGGAQRPGELAIALAVAPRSITTKVDLAEAAGLVERRSDPSDRRAALIVLTDKGRNLVDQVSAMRAEELRTRLSRLTDDEQTILMDLVRRISAEPTV